MESCELLRAEVVIDSTLGGEGWGYSSYCDGVFIVGLSEILQFLQLDSLFMLVLSAHSCWLFSC